jgi:transcriptional regulator of acetoin/glycerol metabolism
LLARLAVRHGCSVCGVAEDAMERMRSYSWPGDVLELENVLRSALLQSESGMIERQHLPEFAENAPALAKKENCPSVKLQDVVERHMMRVLRDCGGNKLRAAERLGISRSTLYRMLDAGAVTHILR